MPKILVFYDLLILPASIFPINSLSAFPLPTLLSKLLLWPIWIWIAAGELLIDLPTFTLAP